MIHILAINGSYRKDGITDQALNEIIRNVIANGAQVEQVDLRDYPINFCLNCRECCLLPGVLPGNCVQNDGMQDLIDKIEHADAFILASPINFGSVTALFKRFMERLTVYAYWPWEMNYPRYRKDPLVIKKKAIIITSCAAPGIFGRLFYSSHKQLKMTARIIGAKTVGGLYTGLIADKPHPDLPKRSRQKAQALARKLL